MATFEAQVEALTSLSIDGSSAPTQTELTQFLTDGAKEVINSFSNNDELLAQCAAKQSTFTSAALESEAESLNTGKILSVYMTDSGATYPCRKINASQKYYYADSSAFASSQMEKATVTDPVYYIQNNFLNAIPSGKTVGYSEVQYPAVAYGDSAVASFPDEAEYLVALYASIKSLQNAMGNKTSSLPADISFPSIPVAPSSPSFDTGAISISTSVPTYTSPVFSAPTLESIGDLTLPVAPAVPSLSAQSVTITGTAPTYVKPTLSSQTAFNDYWTLGDFGDSDPGAFSINSVPPSVPTISVASVTITGTAPTYVGPSYSQIDTYIDTDEDVELAQAKLQEVSSQIQDSLNRFNDDNVEYQAKLQKDIQNAQLTDSNEAKKLQKYSAELQQYQSNVSKEVQEYTQKLSRYQLELNTVFQAWSKTESDNLAKYQSDIQNELNTFNDSNVEYQANLQKDLQDAQLSDSNESRKLQKYSNEVQTYSAEVNAKVQEWVNEEWTQKFQKYQQDYSLKLQEYNTNLQNALNNFNKENTLYQNELQEKIQEANNQQTKDSAEYSAKIQKYSNEMQSYSAEVNKSVQDFNTKLQKHSTDYQWLQSQYAQLKSDYNYGLQLLLGRPLTAGEQQRR